MSSKAVPLAISFGSALTALILSPMNNTVALGGSGAALLVSCGFFYVGLKNFFADREEREQQRREILTGNFQRLIDAQSRAEKQRQELFDELANLSDAVKDSVAVPLAEMPDALAKISAQVKILNDNAETIGEHVGKLKKLVKVTEELADELISVAQKVDKIAAVKDALKSLENAVTRQEEFYKTALNQYREMSGRDVDLIENLARKLR